MTDWRLITDPALPGAVNMARDMAILEAVSSGEAPPTLRFYGWDPPCLTLGKHQGLDVVDLEFCRREGIDVVRRPTGGRALLHHLELTYSVVAPLGAPPLPTGLQQAYRLICGALVRAIRAMGVDAELTGGEVNLRLPNPTSTIPCFEAPAGGEVVVRGRKLIGSAMRAHAGCILQHGAVLLDWGSRLQAGAMGLHDDASLRPHITTLSGELGREVRRGEVEEQIITAFGRSLGVSPADGTITRFEATRTRELNMDVLM
ncbi:MAG: lipoate--protein ligase family protein [Thermoanaerobaculales bacterium]|jgi:lipoate-protein ligase A|nr:lipoate--protein ligase family protein [Thermoanaerobaculales bacterium]